MNADHLTRMANQIGAFFEAMPDREQAAKDVASHMERNWEPRMMRDFLAHIEKIGATELKPIVRDALPLLRR